MSGRIRGGGRSITSLPGGIGEAFDVHADRLVPPCAVLLLLRRGITPDHIFHRLLQRARRPGGGT